MIVCNTVAALRRALQQNDGNNFTTGLVPTMGTLHRGHFGLVHRSIAVCQRTVVSIFVNPVQFESGEDYKAYPRNLENDLALLKNENVDYCFIPSVEEIWSARDETFVDMSHLSTESTGGLRPGHFRGVSTVVAKLFNIVRPDKAFFGEKDYQQLLIIRQMVKDLFFPIDIVGVETFRDDDGVAYSSRNQLLSCDERRAAAIIPESWKKAEQLYQGGERSAKKLEKAVRMILKNESSAIVEAVELRDIKTFSIVTENIKSPVVLLLTVRFGQTRLIDQHILSRKNKE